MIVTTDLFGDILSDEIAGLVGGLGMAPGANIGEHVAIFEAVHGSAPDNVGRDIANPLAFLLASALMLDHLKRPELAQNLRQAIQAVLNKGGISTPELGGRSSTKEFTKAIVERVLTTH